MKLAQFTRQNSDQPRLGGLIDDGVCDVAELARGVDDAGGKTAEWLLAVSSTLEVVRRGPTAIDELQSLFDGNRREATKRGTLTGHRLDGINFLPAVNASKVLAIGRNYIDHAIEGGAEPPKAPLIFNKLPNSLNAHEAPIVLPSVGTKIDYEAELAVVIGKRAKQVSEDEALAYVFGYTLINDVTARDLQRGDGQWTRGKGLDSFAPIGPFITTRDEIEDVQSLKIEGLLNGQVMQSSNTAKMIFKVAYLISYISQGITLEPGDVIATGTPEGVGFFRDPPITLKPGDLFEVRIEKLGSLRNPVIAAVK